MNIAENKELNLKLYTETLENGMKIIVIPIKNTDKKFVAWTTRYGSIDNIFVDPKTKKEIEVPDGVAHYLEHKMFEQENGKDSLYVLMGLGLDANAYTTDSHTSYHFSGTSNFYEGLDELMDYFQHPYFTDENVEKERGIIGQEIRIGEDEPFNKLYYNCMKCMYKTSPVRIDVAGTKDTIAKITKETLYTCYNTFYNPSNTFMCVVGDFEPEVVISEIQKRLLPRENQNEIKRIYPKKDIGINEKKKEDKAEVNMPLFMIGLKDDTESIPEIKKVVFSEMIFDIIFGGSSDFYKKLYEDGLLMSPLDGTFEYTKVSSHYLVYGESKKPEEVYKLFIEEMKNHVITEEEFEREKKRLYGIKVLSSDDVTDIGRTEVVDEVLGYSILDSIDVIKNVKKEDIEKYRQELFKEENSVLSIVRQK